MQQFLVDFQTFSGPLVFYAMQGDSLSRKFQLVITDGGTPWSPPAGAVWSVYFGAPGMSAGFYDTITPASGSPYPAISVAENVATVEIAAQALEIAGINQLSVVVNDSTGYQIASWSIALHIKALPGYTASAATVYYNVLSGQVAQVLENAQAAETAATLAQSWAVGGTGSREGENTNNSQYWAQQAQSIAGGQLGWYATEQALQAAHPTGQNGQWAIIGTTDTIWTWDSDTSAWVDTGATAALSNYYTIPQANAAFATAAQGTKADTAVQSVNGQTGTAITLTPAIIGAATAAQGALAVTAMQPAVYDPSGLGVNTTVQVYTHTRSGTVNNFQGAGAVGRALLTADIQAGDTFTVNGQAVTAYMGASLAAEIMAGSKYAGRWVAFVYDKEEATLNFKGGGGLTADDKAKLIPGNLRSGITLFAGTPQEVSGASNVVEITSNNSRGFSGVTYLKTAGSLTYTPSFERSKFTISGNVGNSRAHAGSSITLRIRVGSETVLNETFGRGTFQVVPFSVDLMDSYRSGSVVAEFSSSDNEIMSLNLVEVSE